MDKSMVKGAVIGGIAMVVLTGGAVTGYKAMNQTKYADVVGVKEVTQKVTTPREDCRQVQVQKQAPVKDENRVAGTVIGGVAGGLLGSTIGGGTGKTVATVAGAAGGAYAGNQVQKNMQQKDVGDDDRDALHHGERDLAEADRLRRDLSPRRQGEGRADVVPPRRADPREGRPTGADAARHEEADLRSTPMQRRPVRGRVSAACLRRAAPCRRA